MAIAEVVFPPIDLEKLCIPDLEETVLDRLSRADRTDRPESRTETSHCHNQPSLCRNAIELACRPRPLESRVPVYSACTCRAIRRRDLSPCQMTPLESPAPSWQVYQLSWQTTAEADSYRGAAGREWLAGHFAPRAFAVLGIATLVVSLRLLLIV